MAIGSLNLTPEDKFVQKLEASLEQKKEMTAPVSPTLPPQSTTPLNRKSTERTKVRTAKHTNERMTTRTNEQKVKRTNGRKKICHAFDIFEDQLISLKEVQLSRQKGNRGKYNLGDLAQEALDVFLTNERTNGQMT